MEDYHHFQLSPFVPKGGAKKFNRTFFPSSLNGWNIIQKFCKVTGGFMVEKKIIHNCGSYFLRKLEKLIN